MKISKLVFLLLFFIFGCDSLTWQYPIKLGDSKEKVQSILGSGELQGKNDLISGRLISKEFYTYPKSGVSITYNDFDRVEKITFEGNYHRRDWISYNGKIVFGIDLDMKLNDLNRILGEPINVSEQVFQAANFSWKKDGILIECEIWMESFEDYAGKVEKDTIRFMELIPSI
ncbi:MAG TPA: hypothetical protein EYN67_00030 [Flavobacteriales bacterium]|nr:hypothetical protein [Flavobacteriales bacterium]